MQMYLNIRIHHLDVQIPQNVTAVSSRVHTSFMELGTNIDLSYKYRKQHSTN